MNDEITIQTKEGDIIYGPNKKGIIATRTSNNMIVLAHRKDINPIILNFSHKNININPSFSDIINRMNILNGFVLNPSYATIKNTLKVQQYEVVHAILDTHGKVIRCDLHGNIDVQNGQTKKVGLYIKMNHKAIIRFNNVEHSHITPNTPSNNINNPDDITPPIELYIPALVKSRIFSYTIKRIEPPLSINKIGRNYKIRINKNITWIQLKVALLENGELHVITGGKEVGAITRENNYVIWKSNKIEFTEAMLNLSQTEGPILVSFKGDISGAEISVLNDEEGWIYPKLVSGKYEIRIS
ncbi:hypothetical protein TCON_1218 [Astathelohania contejeani]|uniref:Uncharacterized protein n=1 Tax=Astathelohania contejeani TaxID=164912 RepID=A0ABQ7HZK7_9MICR|nr:hypothetical protein TCON_1218 [Thelohania contejeani]